MEEAHRSLATVVALVMYGRGGKVNYSVESVTGIPATDDFFFSIALNHRQWRVQEFRKGGARKGN